VRFAFAIAIAARFGATGCASGAAWRVTVPDRGPVAGSHHELRRQPEVDSAGPVGHADVAAENPTSTNIDPLGAFRRASAHSLAGRVTTTYTLSVTGAQNTADKRTVTVVVAGNDAWRVALRCIRSGNEESGATYR